MKKKQASITAQGIAIARVLESDKPVGERICYDPLARHLISPAFMLLGKLFASYGERKGPGMIGFLVARCRYIDDYIQDCIVADIQQLVIMGAGLDSRAYRFKQLMDRIKVFEIDHPATQLVKIKKLKKIFGNLPEHVAFVPVDFNEESLQKLFNYGYSPRKKTLFIWEGVVHYLTLDAVNRTLRFIVNSSMPGSSLIFDYIYLSALKAAHKRREILRMQRVSKYTGEGLTFGIEEGRGEEFLSKYGFVRIYNVTAEDLRKAYFIGINQTRAIAPVYAIVHAVVK